MCMGVGVSVRVCVTCDPVVMRAPRCVECEPYHIQPGILYTRVPIRVRGQCTHIQRDIGNKI